MSFNSTTLEGGIFYFFWLFHVAYEMLALPPGIKPMPPEVEV